MARVDTLTNYLTDVASAIKTKKGDSTPILASNFDTEIENLPSGGGGDTDIYHVNSIQERNSLAANENDFCLVYNKQLGEITETTVTDTLTFPQNVTLDEQLSDFIDGSFRGDTCEVQVSGDSNQLEISIYDFASGNDIRISYTSSDGINYTTQNSQTVSLSSTVSYEGWSPFNPIIGKFIYTLVLVFPGIYQYKNNTWEYLDINVSLLATDILLNKKAYTSNGFVTGTRDLSIYNLTHYKLFRTSLPQEPINDIDYYIVNKNLSLNRPNVYITNKDILNSSSYELNTSYSGATIKGSVYGMGEYDGFTYLATSYGYIYKFKNDVLTQLYSMGKTSALVLCGRLGDYIYLFSSSGSFKYNILTNSVSSVSNVLYSDYGSLIVYNNQLIFFRENKKYTYNINNNSWTPTTVSNIFDTNTIHECLRINGNIVYLHQGKYCFKYNLITNEYQKISLGVSGGSFKQVAGTEYLIYNSFHNIIKIDDELNKKLVCSYQIDLGFMPNIFLYDGKLYLLGTSKEYKITINEDLDLDYSNFNIENFTGVIVQLKDNGIVLEKPLIELLTTNKVQNIYVMDNGLNDTKKVYLYKNDTFTLLFDYEI